jgi:hypothetical protein
MLQGGSPCGFGPWIARLIADEGCSLSLATPCLRRSSPTSPRSPGSADGRRILPQSKVDRRRRSPKHQATRIARSGDANLMARRLMGCKTQVGKVRRRVTEQLYTMRGQHQIGQRPFRHALHQLRPRARPVFHFTARSASLVRKIEHHRALTGRLPLLFAHVRGCVPQCHAILQRHAAAVGSD